jgi:hypothetical protein
MGRRCGNCIHKNVCDLYDIVQDPTHAVGCGNFLDTAVLAPRAEVAREIFAVIDTLGTYNPTLYAELKKKYTEDGK